VSFTKFSCLVGLNGAGKSTVLQAMDFLSQLMRGDLDSWLSERSWAKADLNSKLSARLNIEFEVTLQLDSLGEFVWSGSVNRNSLHCKTEAVLLNGELLLKVQEGECTLRANDGGKADKFKVVFEYQGSILSQLKESQIKGPLLVLRNELLKVHSLDLLSPAQQHSNDVVSGLMAALSQLDSNQHFLIFDEIENGINPELVEFLVDALVGSKHQVLVTTHSPLILNYLEDNIATKGVIYLYKTPKGATQAIPLFSIPSMAEKLSVMGPGEVFVDTHLSELAAEISEMDGGE